LNDHQNVTAKRGADTLILNR